MESFPSCPHLLEKVQMWTTSKLEEGRGEEGWEGGINEQIYSQINGHPHLFLLDTFPL